MRKVSHTPYTKVCATVASKGTPTEVLSLSQDLDQMYRVVFLEGFQWSVGDTR